MKKFNMKSSLRSQEDLYRYQRKGLLKTCHLCRAKYLTPNKFSRYCMACKEANMSDPLNLEN